MCATTIDAVPLQLGTLARDVGAALRCAARYDLHTADGMPLPVYLLEFDYERFAPTAFAATGIACPPSVARSVHRRQAEHFFGRLAARLALSASSFSSKAIPSIPIGPSREPLWPEDMIGSISHSQHLAAATVERCGRRRGIGIDIEPIVAVEAREALLATVVNTQETAYLGSLVADDWPMETLLTIVFSAKESLFKGAFGAVGRYFDFSAAQVVMLDRERGSVRFALTETLCAQFIQAQHCEIRFDFIRADTVLTHFAW